MLEQGILGVLTWLSIIFLLATQVVSLPSDKSENPTSPFNLFQKNIEIENQLHHISQLYENIKVSKTSFRNLKLEAHSQPLSRKNSRTYRKALRKYLINHKKFVEAIISYTEDILYWNSVFRQRITEARLNSWSDPYSIPAVDEIKAARYFQKNLRKAYQLLNFVKIPKKDLSELELLARKRAQKFDEAYNDWRRSPETPEAHKIKEFLKQYASYRSYKLNKISEEVHDEKEMRSFAMRIETLKKDVTGVLGLSGKLRPSFL
jgi:hypothetical protein